MIRAAVIVAGLVALGPASPAHAEDAPRVCEAPTPLDPGALSVAWIAPAGRKVGLGGWMTVVPTRTLRAWIATEGADAVRVLRGVGLRRAKRPPSRPWVVGVFEVRADELCRPLADVEPGTDVAGARVCERNDRGVQARDDGCGYALDHTGDRRSVDVYQIRWRDAAARGFCMLPLERFLDGE